ncbi:hypothetical protein [Zunongwangia atlantica]|uniref:Uncharacterized protein n=1 Tax=Zunongwangia atlantica 22II14-10F7 TaxID=1185767 RepID=A0A1Y1SZJ5_9FLAO|nr:hypothetical protein [Zunongwangia atlantica]ORL43785.1 hypothetical protein IIF7_19074 [Zunongwangia atlantica 22II14-10F7]
MEELTIEIDDVVKEIKTFLKHNPELISASLNKAEITLDKHTKPLTKIKGKYPQAHTLMTDVVQGFSTEWKEMGKLQIEHKILTDYHQKVNYPIIPADILHSYFADLYAEDKKPEEMPISKYIIENELLPKVIDNIQTLSISGTYDAARLDEFGFSMNGIETILSNLVDRDNAPKHPVFEIPVDVFTDVNIVDQVTAWERKLPGKIKKKIKKIFMSENNFERYVLDYENKFGQNKFQGDVMKTRLGKREIVVLDGMESDVIFGTTENNFRRLMDVFDKPRITDVQKQDYKVKIFMEWWKGYDFLINELVVVSNFSDERYGLGSTELNQKYFGIDGVTEAAA